MTTRRLAAILAADIVGFSSMMEKDEEGTASRIRAVRREVIEPKLSAHQGRLIKTTGDGFLAEFASPVEAVRCALSVQDSIAERGEANGSLKLRIGINLGDIIVEHDGDVFGDGVNVAARLEQMADPGGVLISGKIYEEIEGKVERRFESRGEQQVKNLARPVRVYALAGTTPARVEPKPLPLPDKPSIAVLPFTNMSGDPEQEYFADGVVEEITSALSRVRSFFVVARNSSFTFKGKPTDIREVSRVLGVRYVLAGSIRKSGNRLRISAQLFDAAEGSHAWADRYEGEVAEIFDFQDRVTEAIVGVIEPTITLSEVNRAKRKRPDSLDAYDHVMRAMPAIWSHDAGTIQEALRLTKEAIGLDETYALPRALGAWCYAQRIAYLHSSNPAEDRIAARNLAEQAVRLDASDPLVLTCAGAAYAMIQEFSVGGALIEKALRLDPNSAWAWQRSGWMNVYKGAPDIAIEHFKRSLNLSPLDPITFNVYFGIAGALAFKHEYAEAIEWVEKGLREKPDAAWGYRLLTVANYHAGRLEEARIALAKLVGAYPGLTIARVVESTPASHASYLAKLVEAFRALGLPE